MKALPRPSLLVLWLARLYATCVLIFDLMRLVFYSTEPHRVIITQGAPQDAHTGSSSILVYSGPTASFLIQILLVAGLIFGLLMVHRKLGRTMVGIAALGLLSMAVYGAIRFFYLLAISNSIAVGFLHIKLPFFLVSVGCNILFQLANIWLALRPPHRMNMESDNSTPFAAPHSIA